MTKGHVAAALLFCIVLPAYSWRDGTGWLAWTMFSKSQTYRLSVKVIDREGRRHLVNPSALARYADNDAAIFLTGAEHFRHSPIGRAFAANLPGVGHLACREVGSAVEATVTLETRKNLDAEVRAVSNTVSCI